MKIAVDFDGTIVENNFPEIGKPKLFAFETLGALQEQKHQLVLWTIRRGKELDEAVHFCKEHGIEFFAVNENYQGEVMEKDKTSRKILVDMYIDDRNFGGFPGWDKIWQMFNPEKNIDDLKALKKWSKQKKPAFWKKFFK